jgi:hypothetical protein
MPGLNENPFAQQTCPDETANFKAVQLEITMIHQFYSPAATGDSQLLFHTNPIFKYKPI